MDTSLCLVLVEYLPMQLLRSVLCSLSSRLKIHRTTVRLLSEVHPTKIFLVAITSRPVMVVEDQSFTKLKKYYETNRF